VGQAESELVQIVVDCFWRQRRIQALEFALYAHGHDQFEDAFQDHPEENRYNMITLQTHMTYEKQFRNFQIQEARLDRKRAKAMAELQRLQSERKNAEPTESSDAENGFVFSNAGAAITEPRLSRSGLPALAASPQSNNVNGDSLSRSTC
jgi:hypothetical protein